MELKKTNKLNIVLTGGHAATTGIAIIEELWKRYNRDALIIYWIGSKIAIEGSKVDSLENKIFPSLGVKFIPIVAGKIQTKLTRYTLFSILKIPVGFVQSFIALLSIRPKIILSFGGYASFPVVFWGWVFGIPVILHEQTVVAGRATIVSAILSKKIAISRAESSKYFPKSKTVITGNPLMQRIYQVKTKRKIGLHPTILVMGGSRGSRFINEQVFKILPALLKKYRVIHITGEADYEKYSKFVYPEYRVYSNIDPRKMSDYYEESDAIISRSGANTVSEIMATKRPAILIPLPKTFMDEQVKNARYAEKFGIAKVMLENEVNPSTLINQINKLFINWENIIKKVSKNISPDTYSTQDLVDLIKNYLL